MLSSSSSCSVLVFTKSERLYGLLNKIHRQQTDRQAGTTKREEHVIVYNIKKEGPKCETSVFIPKINIGERRAAATFISCNDSFDLYSLSRQ